MIKATATTKTKRKRKNKFPGLSVIGHNHSVELRNETGF